MSDKPISRQPAGVPTGGQFAANIKPKSSLDLGSEIVSPDGMDETPLPESTDILGADTEQLWGYVRHDDPVVRQAAVGNLNISDEQLSELADPDIQPVPVRATVARLAYPGVAARAVRDPSPIVRWLGSNGWDLNSTERELLAEDVDVARVREVMANRQPPSLTS